jgi:CRP-like cAMP-binding protein
MVAPEIIESFLDFENLQENEIMALATLAEEERYGSGEYIFYEGNPATANAAGTQRAMVMTAGPGEIFGWSSLVEPYQLTASAHCAIPVRVVAITASGVRALMAMSCSMGYRLMQKACQTSMGYRLMQKACQTASGRLRATRVQMLSTVRPETP